VALLIVLFLIFAVKRKIKAEKEKARIDEAERTKLLELEIQQMKLEHEKRKIERDKEILEEDVVYKSKELANYTMLLVKKKDLLNELNEDIRQIREGTTNEKVKSKLRSLQSRIKYNLSDEGYLQVFDSNFERVHHDFFRELKMAYPNLSTKELRLCAFVKMNLTNKEIASILNISVRGVETARYRMRKRLSLDHEVNMVEFLDSLSYSGFDDRPGEIVID
jgi:DNA-binding CsgD family transcriptional regulator